MKYIYISNYVWNLYWVNYARFAKIMSNKYDLDFYVKNACIF